MGTRPIRGPIETPDGIVVPGPHGVADDARNAVTESGVSLVESDGEALLVDTGRRREPTGSPAIDIVEERIDRRGLDLSTVVLTHYHYDHVGNAAAIVERHDAEVVCHPADRPVIEDPTRLTLTERLESFGGDPQEVASELCLSGTESLTADASVVDSLYPGPTTVPRTVDDGDTLPVGGTDVRVIHTPGHTPGHLSLYVPGTRSLYLGDVGYWPTPLSPHPVGRAGDQLASVERCLDFETEYLFPGHGLPRCGSTDAEDYLLDALLRARQLEDRLLVLLTRHGPLTVPELHRETFVLTSRNDFDVGGRYVNALHCVHAYLRRLVDAGFVERIERDGTIAWRPTERGRRPEAEVAVRESGGPLTLGDVRNGR
ncbi:MBL fold metallo-hydrolase [Salinirubellus sp. GCM10025818]|uniref:MBL fold metallo-hydrolase n=1 Tax=Salinirubellus TaxID=2162630 RepID=UPI0030CCC256